MANLPAFKVTYEDGTSYVTSMAAGTTYTTALDYFLHAQFEQTDGTLKTVSMVEDVTHA